MEKYVIKDEKSEPLKLGQFYSLVNNKHINAYGEVGANNIVSNVIETYENIQKQFNDPLKNNNVLLVGKVQSGKTSNLELLTAIAFDNGYNILVMYGGYDKSLLAQTTDRFRKTFDVPEQIEYSDKYPAVFTTDDSNQLADIDDDIVAEMLECKQPIIFISMKRPVAMRKINKVLQELDKSKFKAFIIDDEGDQASLNIAKNKKEDASKTYAEIVKLKGILNNPVYLSVTATPHANIFLDDWSALRPDNVRLIQPGIGYDGADVYNLEENNLIQIIPTEDVLLLEDGGVPPSLWDAIHYFIVASAIKQFEKTHSKSNYSDMIIHSFREVDNHSNLYRKINSKIELYKDIVRNKDKEGLTTIYKKLKNIYESKLFTNELRSKINFDQIFEIIKIVIKNIKIILKNSLGKETQSNESLKYHKIYIGGDLLQRGLTFSNLITTYFTRWSKDGGNMDTNMQRARWFGYREKYIDLCKVFTTSGIAQEFSTLGEVETDLWDQFSEIENNQMEISDILIQTENTRQRPTSKNKASYEKVIFKNRWIKQRYIVSDKNQIEINNSLLNGIIKNSKFTDTSVGNKSGEKTGSYCVFDNKSLVTLVNHIQTVFDMEPFQRSAVKELISGQDVIIILMNSSNKNGVRMRTVYPNSNKIKALMQGADNKDKSKVVYEGDSFVIIDKNKINIQIHKVIPKIDGEEKEELIQYMFAIYVPKEKTYYVKR